MLPSFRFETRPMRRILTLTLALAALLLIADHLGLHQGGVTISDSSALESAPVAAFTPTGAIPVGCAVQTANTAQTHLDKANIAIVRTKWTGSGPDGKIANGIYATAAGKVLPDLGAALNEQERKALWAERGAIDSEAWQAFAAMSPAKQQESVAFLGSVRAGDVFCDKVAGPDANCLAAQTESYASNLAQVSAALAVQGGKVTWQNGPFFSGNASPQQLMAIRQQPGVAMLSLQHGSPMPTSLSGAWGDSVLGWHTGVSPSDVKVCLIEGNAPSAGSPWMDGLTFAGIRFPLGTPDTWWGHPNQMADVLIGAGSQPGLAPGAQVFVANWKFPYGASGPSSIGPWWDGLTYCRDNQTTVWNFSQRYDSISGLILDGPVAAVAEDRYFDWLAVQPPYPTIVASAGNNGNVWHVNNKLRNGLVVGGSQEDGQKFSSDCGSYNPTPNRAMHTIWGNWTTVLANGYVGSQGLNGATVHGDWELPHVVAPSTSSCLAIAAIASGTGGTSAATAATSAGVAQIQHVNSLLKSWPEACRAIVMATADQNVDGPVLSLTDSVDDLDGAGEINIQAQVILAQPANRRPAPQTTYADQGFDYGTFYLNDSAIFIPNSGGSSRTFYHQYRIQSASTGLVRVVLTWNNASACSNPQTCDPTQELVPDLDMTVAVDQTNQLVGWSSSYDSNYEFIEFQATAGVPYRVWINYYPYSGGTQSYYAIAWTTHAL